MIMDITEIDHLPKPLYVLVAGGIAVGKTHVIKKSIHTLDIMDIDDVMEELGHQEYNDENYREAMDIISSRFDVKMANKESLIAMGTAANFPFTVERLYNAKQAGYQTCLLYITAGRQQAMDQNRLRRQQRKRALTVEEEYKIIHTGELAKTNVHFLKDTILVDYFCHFDNDISKEEFCDLHPEYR